MIRRGRSVVVDEWPQPDRRDEESIVGPASSSSCRRRGRHAAGQAVLPAGVEHSGQRQALDRAPARLATSRRSAIAAGSRAVRRSTVRQVMSCFGTTWLRLFEILEGVACRAARRTPGRAVPSRRSTSSDEGVDNSPCEGRRRRWRVRTRATADARHSQLLDNWIRSSWSSSLSSLVRE